MRMRKLSQPTEKNTDLSRVWSLSRGISPQQTLIISLLESGGSTKWEYFHPIKMQSPRKLMIKQLVNKCCCMIITNIKRIGPDLPKILFL